MLDASVGVEEQPQYWLSLVRIELMPTTKFNVSYEWGCWILSENEEGTRAAPWR